MLKRDKTMAELYRLHYEELLRRACILLHDEEDARDAVSDVMARQKQRALRVPEPPEKNETAGTHKASPSIRQC